MDTVEHARDVAQVEELKAAAHDPRITAEERRIASAGARMLARALDACVDDDERLEVLAGALVYVARGASRAALNAVGLDVLAGGV